MQSDTIQGFRLSPQQRDLWSALRNGQSGPYNSCCAVQIDGELNAGLLQCALDHVVAQREILRTSFQLLPGMTIPVQVIAEEGVVSLETHDLTALAVNDQIAELDRLILLTSHRHIDCTRLPLLRADLV